MGSRHLVSPTLLRLGKDKSSAGESAAFVTWPSCGLGFSGPVGGFRGFWASLKLQRHCVPARRWLLTLGLISLTFLAFFTAVLSRQPFFGKEAPPAAGWSVTAIHTLAGLSCPLAAGLAGPPAPLPAQDGWKTVVAAPQLCACGCVGAMACSRAPTVWAWPQRPRPPVLIFPLSLCG